jgi:hypothetical protein
MTMITVMARRSATKNRRKWPRPWWWLGWTQLRKHEDNHNDG